MKKSNLIAIAAVLLSFACPFFSTAREALAEAPYQTQWIRQLGTSSNQPVDPSSTPIVLDR